MPAASDAHTVNLIVIITQKYNESKHVYQKLLRPDQPRGRQIQQIS
jgi:hypothetical protein